MSKRAQYLLTLEPDRKARLEAKAKQAGIPLAEAMREGAEQYLDERIGNTEDPLVAEFRALAARVNHRLQGGT